MVLLSLRGVSGNPSEFDINSSYWKDNGPFELSPERGRFALTYSLVEDKSFEFNLPIARFATPDLGFINGKYVSLFAPGISFLIIPGYQIGKVFGFSQVGAFAVISFFAIMNVFLIDSIARKLGAKKIYSAIASVAFLFATPAFTYAVSLYQHHVSVFLILAGIFVYMNIKDTLSSWILWFLVALSIPIDYPNFFMMMPLITIAVLRFFKLENLSDSYKINLRISSIIGILGVVAPILFLGWVNIESYGDPFRLSGTVTNVRSIDAQGLPRKDLLLEDSNLNDFRVREDNPKSGILGFFNTRNISEGLYIHLFSPDRGILFFAPFLIFSITGAFILYGKNPKAFSLLVGVILVNLVVYSLWGDPWGGWAFGSRYLIPFYAINSILLAIGLEKIFQRNIMRLIFLLVLTYSVFVNSLGAITTSTNPPKIEVLQLEELSGKEEKYTFVRNWDYLNNIGSKSFIYNSYLKDILTPVQFYFLISFTLSFFFLGLYSYEALWGKLPSILPFKKFGKNKLEDIITESKSRYPFKKFVLIMDNYFSYFHNGKLL